MHTFKYETLNLSHTLSRTVFQSKAQVWACRAHTRAVRILSNSRAPMAKTFDSDSRRVTQAALSVAEAGTGSRRLPRQQRTLADIVDICVCRQHLPPRKCGSVPRAQLSDLVLRSRYDEGIRHIVN